MIKKGGFENICSTIYEAINLISIQQSQREAEIFIGSEIDVIT